MITGADENKKKRDDVETESMQFQLDSAKKVFGLGACILKIWAFVLAAVLAFLVFGVILFFFTDSAAVLEHRWV